MNDIAAQDRQSRVPLTPVSAQTGSKTHTRSHLATVNDPDIQGRPLADGAHVLHHPDHAHALAAVLGVVAHLAEDHVLAVQVRRRGARHEELAAVGVRAGVGHGEQARAGVGQEGPLVGEGARVVDGRVARSQEVGRRGVDEVAGLEHEGCYLGGLLEGLLYDGVVG